MPSSRDDAVLAASLTATRLLVTSNNTATVEDLARAAGVSRRTWFRYFAAKEDCIRPMLHEASAMTLQIFDDRLGHEPLCEAFLTGFRAISGGLFAERTRTLLPVVFASPQLSAVLDSEAVRTAGRLRALLERRLDNEIDRAAIAAISTVLPALAIAALRDSLAQHRSASHLLAERIEALRLGHLTLSL